MTKIQVGSHVRIGSYGRLRTIFVNAEHNPGKWQEKKGYTGTVVSIEDDGMGGDTYYIESDKPRGGPGVVADISYEYHPVEELELI